MCLEHFTYLLTTRTTHGGVDGAVGTSTDLVQNGVGHRVTHSDSARARAIARENRTTKQTRDCNVAGIISTDGASHCGGKAKKDYSLFFSQRKANENSPKLFGAATNLSSRKSQRRDSSSAGSHRTDAQRAILWPIFLFRSVPNEIVANDETRTERWIDAVTSSKSLTKPICLKSVSPPVATQSLRS